MTRRRVSVSGIGVASSIGIGVEAFKTALCRGESGVKFLQGARWSDLAGRVGATIDVDLSSRFTFPERQLLDRTSVLAIVAANEAVTSSGLTRETLSAARQRVGLFFGTAMGGIESLETAYESIYRGTSGRPGPYAVLTAMYHAPAAHLSMKWGVLGRCYTYSVACASSAIAIGEAFHRIREGELDIAICGGADACITPGVVKGWEALRVLAPPQRTNPDAACRPFSKDRCGVVLGEGSAFLILEALENIISRGAAPRADVVGYACTADAVHITQPSADGQAAAISSALDDAAMHPDELTYINAHGTGTPAGDIVETHAIKAALGRYANHIPVSSTKAMHGHCMGAAGALEFAASIMAMEGRFLPPTANLRVADPDCDLDYVPNAARHRIDVATVMSNAFAFGGTNAVLIARKAP